MECSACGGVIYQRYIPELHEHLLSCHTPTCSEHVRHLKRKLSRLKNLQKRTQGMSEAQKEYYVRHMRY